MIRLLVVDDEASLRETMEMFFREKGYEVKSAETGAKGLALARTLEPHVIILDIRLPDALGLDLMAPLARALPHSKTIIITAHHDMETTIEAMRRGAYDYIHKPIDVYELEKSVRQAARIADLGASAPSLPAECSGENDRVKLVGDSIAMRQIFKTIGVLAGNRAGVLIEGETGTGKEVIARVIHDRSNFRDQPFVAVDCTTLVDSLMESELFGHEKGSFTGAVAAKKGRLELADQGTIFFDEIGDLPARLQAKLLRFLERREFTRVGGTEVLHSRARIIAAANQNLGELASRGAFRPDLLFRLKVVTIRVPPLRERLEDLEEMVPFFMRRINMELQTKVGKLEKGAMDVLRKYSWPGNVRELINVLTKSMIESRGPVLLAEAVETAITAGEVVDLTGQAPGPAPADSEKSRVARAVAQTHWNISAAARILGISRPTLRKRLKQYGLQRPLKEETIGKAGW